MNWLTPEITDILKAIIAAAVAVLVALISARYRGGKASTEPSAAARTATAPPTAPTSGERLNACTTPPSSAISSITHEEMSQHIMRVPPLQRDSIARHYLGLRVRWQVSLCSCDYSSPEWVLLHAESIPEGHMMECHARPEDVACLLQLPAGGVFVVEGTLHRADRSFCILHDCKASLPARA